MRRSFEASFRPKQLAERLYHKRVKDKQRENMSNHGRKIFIDGNTLNFNTVM